MIRRYVAESSLADEGNGIADGKLRCGKMAYEVLLVPSCLNIRKSTLDQLIRFPESGSALFFVGDTPRWANCVQDAALDRLVESSPRISLSRQTLLETLAPWREVDFLENGKKRTKNLLYQLRQEEENRWLLIAQAYGGMKARQEEVWYRRPLHDPQKVEILVKGLWNAEKFDTLTGETETLSPAFRNGWTVLDRDLYGNDSLLLRLIPAKEAMESPPVPADVPSDPARRYSLPEPFDYVLSEPNVFLLDRFEYALDDEAFQPMEEMLRLDNQLRARLDWSLRGEALAQPYVRVKEERRDHRLRLKAVFSSEIAISGCFLALEEAAFCTGTLNGQPIDWTPCGYYVDEALSKVRLPDIRQGKNELVITMMYGDCTNPEWMYILYYSQNKSLTVIEGCDIMEWVMKNEPIPDKQ